MEIQGEGRDQLTKFLLFTFPWCEPSNQIQAAKIEDTESFLGIISKDWKEVE